MSNSNLQNLPPEMQARIANIIQQAKTNPAPPETPHQAAIAKSPEPSPPAPPAKPPSLMDHTITLRHEVAAVRQELAAVKAQLNAVAQVTDAVGNAVGQLYSMFHEQSTPTTYSEEFQASAPSQVDDY